MIRRVGDHEVCVVYVSIRPLSTTTLETTQSICLWCTRAAYMYIILNFIPRPTVPHVPRRSEMEQLRYRSILPRTYLDSSPIIVWHVLNTAGIIFGLTLLISGRFVISRTHFGGWNISPMRKKISSLL